MNIEEMSLDEVVARLAQLEIEVRDASEVEFVEKATEEKKALHERKAELVALEERRATAEALKTNEVEGKIIEKSKEKNTMEERTFAVDTVEYRDAYLKALMGKAVSVEERGALTTAASIIPTETVNKIYGKLEENPLIAEIDTLHVPGYVKVPKATTVNDASWVAIGTAATDSEDVVGSVSLTAKKLIKTIEITADIQAMSIDAFQNWLVNKLVEKMEAAICAAVINGASNGASGITDTLAGKDKIAKTVAGLSSLMAKLGSAYHKDAVWVMSANTFFGDIVPLASDSNGALVMNGLDYRLLGHKVILDSNAKARVNTTKAPGGSAEAAATEHIFFGSFKAGYVFNYGEGIAIEADQSVAFRSGSTVYRAMALCDGAVVDNDAFVWSAFTS